MDIKLRSFLEKWVIKMNEISTERTDIRKKEIRLKKIEKGENELRHYHHIPYSPILPHHPL